MKTRVVLKIGHAKLPERSIFGNVGNVRDVHPYARGYRSGLHELILNFDIGLKMGQFVIALFQIQLRYHLTAFDEIKAHPPKLGQILNINDPTKSCNLAIV